MHEEDKDLKVEVYNNAFVLPFRDSSKGVEINDEGGVSDSNCTIVGLSKTRKSISHIKVGYSLHYNFSSNTTYLNEDVVFLGYFSTHFGHFIFESLNRLWIYLNSERFRSITVPEEPNLIKESFYNKKYKETFKRIANGTNKSYPYDKIYLSRTKFIKRKGSIAGEAEIKKLFKNNGFTIIYTERLGIKEQISLMKNCKYLLGIQGTAMHMSIFADDGINLIVIHRSKDKIFPE